ncbi:zinc-dependent alcohol dehydrogenase [Microbacterium thalassium]|uniref:(R,R)-butanediol dehydrogenase/meso-butanediol dehydrogenase/diacetyl reductase/L-iditol 2-dehydrogenase n=1 Tax=Microbacterium thalassium TaxID=362649 RepID=A0A7X0FMQ1_9MICO|nr:alcohol dehydrogenase catalytic domain-containing protein [Microbacterium thalassium]MBB6389831.1 (R,R)-butanediol dehydrogenase/meso-butanediol dehydrogenase/diacetyl reductase/L-iditol 2-dehydrogenase [Microbacterium thalassium]GLK24519.1 galactitol-1-phosphate 5-dehydrogenase [Microbacterium thalassium]
MKTVAVTKVGRLADPDEDARGTVEVIDFPRQPLGPEDVRIRIAYSSICGSDPHVAEGFFRRDVPFGLGHEVSGVIVELGERTTRSGLSVGDRVACNFLKFCGVCRPCLDGRQQFCENLRNEYRRPGMSEEVVWHESQVYRLPDSVSLLEGCLLEPTSIAVRIADKARIRVGDRVAVCGGGPIGQLALQVLKMSGATSLTMIEPIAERREIALATGAEHVIDPIAEDQAARADEITDGRGYDLVVDASGSPRAVRGLLDLATKGGTVVYGAMYPHDYELPLNLAEYLYQRELTLTGVFVAPYAFPRAMQILPHLELAELTRAVFPLEDAAEAFQVHLSGKHPKVVLKCNDLDDLDLQ